MRASQPIAQEPFHHALLEAQDEMQARCRHCILPPNVEAVPEWDAELWLQVWSDAAGAARRRAAFALNDGLNDDAWRGYWLAAYYYRTAARFLSAEDNDPRHTLLTTGEAACLRMATMIQGTKAAPDTEKIPPAA